MCMHMHMHMHMYRYKHTDLLLSNRFYSMSAATVPRRRPHHVYVTSPLVSGLVPLGQRHTRPQPDEGECGGEGVQ